MGDRRLRPLWDLGELPFHIGAQENPSNGQFPESLPFVIGVDEGFGFLVQMPRPEVIDLLQQAYRKGHCLGTPMDETGLGREYCDDFFSFIKKSLGSRSLDGLEVLEIGCGRGFLLKTLHEQGARVVGVEQGSTLSTYANEANLKVISQEFNPRLFDQKFDLIIHYGVLEHLSDPTKFLSQQRELLAEDGLIIFSVPDCAECLLQGDLSMFLHEHWSYFSQESLEALVTTIALKIFFRQKADVGGAIYFACTHDQQRLFRNRIVKNSSSAFVERARRELETLQQYLSGVYARGESVGIYCPARFINYLVLLDERVKETRCFDDDPQLDGKYFLPFVHPVESRAGLLADPVDNLLIVSRSFGDAIAASFQNVLELKSCTIKTIRELF